VSSSTPLNRASMPLTCYFLEIRATAIEATSLHREWKQQVARLVTSISDAGPEQILAQTGTTGLYFDLSFARCRRQLDSVEVPDRAERYHHLWLAWLDHMALASRALGLAARHRDRTLFGCCRAILVEAGDLLSVLSDESDQLRGELSRERRGTAA
jgi:hypothetical protein